MIKVLFLLSFSQLSLWGTEFSNHKRLILIELKGGNDGLNTVIPYQDPLYYKLRPNIAINKNEVLPLNNQLALHSSMKEIKKSLIKMSLSSSKVWAIQTQIVHTSAL